MNSLLLPAFTGFDAPFKPDIAILVRIAKQAKIEYQD
jgi:hypothetical protein